MGSPSGGVDGSGPGGNGSPGRGSDNDSSASSRSSKSESSQAGMTGSERTRNGAAGKDSFEQAMDEARSHRPGGPEGGDTTPGYGGPNPDPRGPTLGDGPGDTQDEDIRPAVAKPGDLPESDTTPAYAGPGPDPLGPTLSGRGEDDKSTIALAGTVAIGAAAADGPLPIGDLIGLGIVGYAGYKALTNPPSIGPLLSEKPEGVPGDIADQPTRPADKPGKIASETGLTEREVKEKIHEAKRNLPRGSEVRNPDVAVDLDNGEIHPKNEDGTYGDSIGNIYD